MIDRSRNQLLIVATNSFWSIVNFLITGIFGFLFSIILARYLGPTYYGKYSYIFSIAAVLILIFGLGVNSTIAKYIPIYYPDPKKKTIAINLFKFLASLQFLVSATVMLAAFFLKGWWATWLGTGYLSTWLIIVLLAYIPFIGLTTAYVVFVGSTQNYKKLAITSLITLLINALLLIVGILCHWHLDYFILINIVTNVLVGGILYIFAFSLGRAKDVRQELWKEVGRKGIRNYAVLSYIGIWINTIIWSYAAVFFLKYFSSIEDIGFYSLAVLMAGALSGLFATSQGAISNAQFELLAQNQEEKSDMMTYLAVKYSTLIFLPIVIFLSLIFTDLVKLVYGTDYRLVGVVFPLIFLAKVLPTIFSPITTKIKNDNRLFTKMTKLLILGGALTLLINYLLILRFGLIGAGLASIAGQLLIVYLTVNFSLRSVKFNFLMRDIYLLIGVNLILAIVTFAFYQLKLNWGWSLFYCILSIVTYIKFVKFLKQFKPVEISLMKDLVTHMPGWLSTVVYLGYIFYKKI